LDEVMSTPLRPIEAIERAFARIDADGREGIWIELVDRARVGERAALVTSRVADGEHLPLAGRTFAVKGNIDVVGIRTTAACPSFGDIASESATAVRRLEAAGAIVIGVTNLDQFATGLVGTRSPYGICPNAHWPAFISGGSSSGSAVAVAAGHVDFSLGTDTAGSGRVPAAANGIVGIKPTRGRIPTTGVVPACRSLDCISMFAADLRLAALATDIAAGRDPWRASEPADAPTLDRVRIALPSPADLDFDGDPNGPARFEAAVDQLVRAAGASAVTVTIEPFLAVGRLLYGGAFVAERYAAVGAFVDAHPDEVDPVVAAIVRAAGEIPAWQLLRDQAELVRLRTVAERTWTVADVLAVPSVPRLPTVDDVMAEPVSVNAMLGTYTNFVNLLDLCAVTLPVGDAPIDCPPASVTLIAPAGRDAHLVELAAQLGSTAGARPARHAEASAHR
jgi:allophanate hydrolase